MTQEDKDLLLKDLCARLPYGTRDYAQNANDWYDDEINIQVLSDAINENYIIKPYLFPLSSMTEEQCNKFYCGFVENETDYNDFKKYYFDGCLWNKVLTSINDCGDIIDWFNKNHFDYRGLIPMGLAIDATELNIY